MSTESDEMHVLSDWLDAIGVVWIHVRNEGRHVPFGVKAGFPDILIFDPPRARVCAGTALELKRPGGRKPSPNQVAWLARLETKGWATACCYGADAAIQWLQSLGYGLR